MSTLHRTSVLVIDLAFGDCGKGTIVDFLARRHDRCTVVRFNGGPQAGHNVVTRDGRHHTFSQFGAGSFVPSARTFLSRFMLIEPYALLNEAQHLDSLGVPDVMGRLTIDGRCAVITPAHQAANRLRELARGEGAYGTCGMGVGETVQDTLEHPDVILHARDLSNRGKVRAKLQAACELKAAQLRDVVDRARCGAAVTGAQSESQGHGQASTLAHATRTLLSPTWIDAAADNYAELARHVTIADEHSATDTLRDEPALIFEGAQGVLLDENVGFHPHTTWSTTTFANADALLDEAGRDGPRTRLGVIRSYFTRHGAGPLVTEDPSLAPGLPEPHNTATGWQGQFRVGVFDAVAARYALAAAGGADALAVTQLDRIANLPPQLCTGYVVDHGELAEHELFHVSADIVTDIRVHARIDLARQERLTATLKRCRPVMSERRHRTAADFLVHLRDVLGVPIAITSNGASADDKRLLDCVPVAG
jgi:adenylosuccinate synthase